MNATKLKLRKSALENLYGWLFIGPQMLGILVFSILPVLFSFYLSFTSWDFVSGFDNINFIGLKNYINIWKDVAFTASLKNTIVFSFAVVILELVLGLVIATVIDRVTYCSTYLKVAFFVPYISSLVAVSVVFKAILQPTYGPVNQFLMGIGIQNPPGWFGDQNWSLFSVVLLTVWRDLGYYVIVFTAALKGISNELYEAADIDGANGISKFFAITIPLVKPTTFFLMVTGVIGSFKAFDQVAITTQGGPGTSSSLLVYYVYNSAFSYYKMGYACSMAWVLFALIFIVTVLQWRFQNTDVE